MLRTSFMDLWTFVNLKRSMSFYENLRCLVPFAQQCGHANSTTLVYGSGGSRLRTNVESLSNLPTWSWIVAANLMEVVVWKLENITSGPVKTKKQIWCQVSSACGNVYQHTYQPGLAIIIAIESSQQMIKIYLWPGIVAARTNSQCHRLCKSNDVIGLA